jgi:anion-transporting  ArsA/GET3 family ATPase
MAMSVLGRLFGQDVLPDIAEFFLSFQDVLPKLNEATAATDRLLRSPGTNFAIVTAPGETALREARHLHGELVQAGVPFAGFVCNRVLTVPAEVHQIRLDDPHGAQLRERLAARGMAPVAAELQQAAQWLDQLAAADAAHVDSLRRLAAGRGFVAIAPLQAGDLHTLADLAAHGRRLLTS